MANCLICSDLLLRQVKGDKSVLYCRTCRVEYDNHHSFSSTHSKVTLKDKVKEPVKIPVYSWRSSVVDSAAIAS
jgi:DNA-directed RNA polymerase subunit M/transcription elongation factor TFIIS